MDVTGCDKGIGTGASMNAEDMRDNVEGNFKATFWDCVAATTWGSYITELERQVTIQGHLAAGTPAKAVDIGCGSGRWSKLLSDLGWQMTCVDVDRQALDICQQRIPEAKAVIVHRHDEIIPCETASKSLVLCIEVKVIESHWFLFEVKRVLKHDGVFVGVWWNRRSWRGMAWRLKHRLMGSSDVHDFYKQSYSWWKAKLARLGFRVLFEEGLCWAPFGRTSNSALIPLAATLERATCLHRLVAFSPWIIFVARKVSA